jgi:membrane protease YdiL (CAAX protease family)
VIKNSILRKFLGLGRVEELRLALTCDRNPAEPLMGSLPIALAVLISLLPLYGGALTELQQRIDAVTLFVGIAACLALVLRARLKIPFQSVSSWKDSLRLTHTAFALGCIPTVLVLLIHPEALYQIAPHEHAHAAHPLPPHRWNIGFLLLQVSVWAGLTEEIIYRGLLISVLRRWNIFPSQGARDIFALLVSSLIFGATHFLTWGLVMSYALFGLGLGLGAAYLAIGERLLPVVIYHIIFDSLSLAAAFFTFRVG